MFDIDKPEPIDVRTSNPFTHVTLFILFNIIDPLMVVKALKPFISFAVPLKTKFPPTKVKLFNPSKLSAFAEKVKFPPTSFKAFKSAGAANTKFPRTSVKAARSKSFNLLHTSIVNPPVPTRLNWCKLILSKSSI